LLASRLATGLPPAGWAAVGDDGRGGAAPLLAALTIAVAVVAAVVLMSNLTRKGAGDRRTGGHAALLLIAVGATLAVTSALLGSLSQQVQGSFGLGEGFRETPGVVAGLSLGATGLIAAPWTTWAGRGVAVRVGAGLVAVVVAATAATTLRVNADRVAADSRRPEAVLTNALAVSLVNLEPTAAGDARRCALLDAVRDTYGALPRDGVLASVDDIARARAGVPYCSAAEGNQ
jgi:hypothetical protein